MKTNSTKKSTTLGEFITRIYDDCGERKAQGIVRLAIMARLIKFRGHKRGVIS
jgi:hypothetical protein